MCGVVGFWTMTADIDETRLRRTVTQMSDALAHRGPDSSGVWIEPETGVALGHRRLAVIDLSEAGHQPMISADRCFVISYNGEIYNFGELRDELEGEGAHFKGASDTEVILAACRHWGVSGAVRRFIGMFAFALWDARERRMHLVRDRLGIKPLYWSLTDGILLFGSELKGLRAHPRCPTDVDRDALASFMRHNYVPAPRTIYAGVRKLQPGCVMTITSDGSVREVSYWNTLEVAQREIERRAVLDDQEALDDLESLLLDAVRRRMVADVPLGAFLSGGIDSSLVVALMQAQSARAVRTFSIGFREPEFDEANHAKEVARHLGTDHTELYVEPAHALEVIPKLPEWYDEPFADSSQIPTFLVSELTRKHVTVSLSGDGGDELFAGYNRYLHAVSIMERVAPLPGWLRGAGAAALSGIPARVWDLVFRAVPGRWRPRHAGDKVHKLAAMLRQTRQNVYLGLISHWQDPSEVVLGGNEVRGVLWDAGIGQRFADPVEHMQYLDTVTYLPDDILTKVDRASMAVSLEARVPLIDHRLVEMSWRLPSHMKIRNGVSKWALREVLYKHVPRALIERPKMGFGVPIDRWLRGPLREWAEELLEPRALEADGYFRAAPIRTKWDEHQSGRHNWQYLLWDVLMFQAWKRRWL